VALLLLGLLLVVIVSAASALADESAEKAPPTSGSESPGSVGVEGESSPNPETQPTDPSAAEGVELTALDRKEAGELLEGVFGQQIEASAGSIDNLEAEKYLANNVAVLPAEDGGSEGVNSLQGAALLESTVPLRTEAPSGKLEPVDLTLEDKEGRLGPANPIAEVDVPQQLGEGIGLPEVGVQIALEGAQPDRAPSIEENTAFYPNVSQDLDLAVAATPTGLETFTQVRSAAAAGPETFEMNLPQAASLRKNDAGGAEVVDGGEKLIDIAPPYADDASGNSVPIELGVDGSSFTFTLQPSPDVTYPILVDPLIQTYAWQQNASRSGINGNGNNDSYETMFKEEWTPEQVKPSTISTPFTMYNHCECYPLNPPSAPVQHNDAGLYVFGGSSTSSSQPTPAGVHAAWVYAVPRYFTDKEKYGVAPESYISHLTLSRLLFQAHNQPGADPYMELGIITPGGTWLSNTAHNSLPGGDLEDMAHLYEYNNAANVEGKMASAGLWTFEPVTYGATGSLFVGAASVEISEPATSVPKVGTPLEGPAQWVNQEAAPITATVTDAGLGVYAMTLSNETGTLHSWKTTFPCTGVGDSACPRKWQVPGQGQPELKYEPALLAQGTNNLKLVAEDPLGHVSSVSHVQVKVDHTAPQVALSGTLTEQGSLGAARPYYTLKWAATDGTAAEPQSGAAKVVVKVDGSEVRAPENPGCSTQNCPITNEWTLDASKFSAGTHTAEVVATDAVGISSAKTVSFALHPTPPPSLTLSGSMTEEATLGTTRPRYNLNVSASATGEEGGAIAKPTYSTSFGSAGTGNAQFNHPGDVALDAKGNLWVADVGNNRLEEFNEKGEFLKALGSLGTGNGQFTRPKSIAFDAKGNIWVADSGNNRLEEFNEKGEFLKVAGAAGAGNGQFSGPESIAVDPHGNIWVADTYNLRVQELNEKGEFLKVVNPSGLGAIEPTGLDVGPGGNIWVADWAHNRIVELSEAGALVRQFGSAGTGNGQFSHPDAVTIDSKGDVWVADQSNARVQQFNQNGEYLTQFGSAGTGAGQFSLTYPVGIAADSKGNLWIADTNNNRIQKWLIAGYVPTYSTSFGAAGTGNGQFNHPGDAALDSKGNIWVVDRGNSRLEQFNEKGVFLKTAGGVGTSGGKLTSPSGVAIDLKGNIWVTDTSNNRIGEFNEAGAFVATFGKDVDKTKVTAGGTEAQKNLCTAASGDVCQAGASGSANGQFNQPTGIAATAGGNLLVADTGNSRVQKMGPEGAYLAKIGSLGSGPAQLAEPRAVAVAPDGSIWVADTGNDRLQQWSSTFEWLRQVGSTGSGNGQFSRPGSVEVGGDGKVWVADQNNERVQELNQNGEYLTQFGSAGTGAGQFSLSYPMGIAADAKGNLWIADTNNNRIQKWSQGLLSSSEISTEVTIDGKKVDAGTSSCSTTTCPISRLWTLESPAYLGKHAVVVKATDGYGRTTTKSLTVEAQSDTTKPVLQASGALVAAPEGWVEQESYGFAASATDTGYGASSLVLKIDGASVASTSKSCPDGGCEVSLSKPVNMSAYSGGSHAAEILATDGAGNSTAKKWTINVDPEGHVSAVEAEETLEAADETSSSTIVAPTSEFVSGPERADGNNPSLEPGKAGLESSGTPDLSIISTDPSEGFAVQVPEGKIKAEPVETGGGVTPVIVAEEVAAVVGNTAANTDSVTRPIFDGVMTYQSIRDQSAPEEYSWELLLTSGQKVKTVDSQDVEIDYADGTEAMLISAELAHDAVGTAVPTTLKVSGGNIITLKVAHRGGPFVYPVVGGAGWEGGYTTEIVPPPKDRLEIEEEEARIEREEIEAEERVAREQRERENREFEEGVGPDEGPEDSPEPRFGPKIRAGASISVVSAPEMVDRPNNKRRSRAVAEYCSSWFWDGCSLWKTEVLGSWYWNGKQGTPGGYAWRGDTQLHCNVSSNPVILNTSFAVGWAGANPAPYGYGQYVDEWCNFETAFLSPEDTSQDAHRQIQNHLFGDGYQKQHIHDIGPEEA